MSLVGPNGQPMNQAPRILIPNGVEPTVPEGMMDMDKLFPVAVAPDGSTKMDFPNGGALFIMADGMICIRSGMGAFLRFMPDGGVEIRAKSLTYILDDPEFKVLHMTPAGAPPAQDAPQVNTRESSGELQANQVVPAGAVVSSNLDTVQSESGVEQTQTLT